MEIMNLETKKLEFIEEYIRLNDESIINKLEEVLREEKRKSLKEERVRPLTQAEMDAMLEESEEDIRQGNVLSHESVKQEVLRWRTNQKK